MSSSTRTSRRRPAMARIHRLTASKTWYRSPSTSAPRRECAVRGSPAPRGRSGQDGDQTRRHRTGRGPPGSAMRTDPVPLETPGTDTVAPRPTGRGARGRPRASHSRAISAVSLVLPMPGSPVIEISSAVRPPRPFGAPRGRRSSSARRPTNAAAPTGGTQERSELSSIAAGTGCGRTSAGQERPVRPQDRCHRPAPTWAAARHQARAGSCRGSTFRARSRPGPGRCRAHR